MNTSTCTRCPGPAADRTVIGPGVLQLLCGRQLRVSMRAAIIAAAALLVWWLAPASDAAIPKGGLHVGLQEIAAGLVSPVGLTHAGDERLFVVDQSGKIRLIKQGVLLPTPFLDISSKMVSLNAGYDERGLLGLAFHPDYASNGKFYVYYSAPGAPSGWNHHSVISEFSVSANPDLASTTERVLLTIDQPQTNHNGGHLQFGPDGYLYIASGDGGNANDTGTGHTAVTGNAQDKNNLLGKMLRIDVDTQDPGLQYGIPADNPYAGAVAGRDEIYAIGFRNPYSFSFDRETGDLYVGDVGQGQIEEIDLVTNGGNYGWKAREGTNVFDPNLPQTGYIDPIAQYTHADGEAVIGGFVYRGSAPSLSGMYIFGDLNGRLFWMDPASTGTLKTIQEARVGFGDVGLGSSYIKGFGEDAHGEVYVLVSNKVGPLGDTSGRVLRLSAPSIGQARQQPAGSAVTLLSKQVSRSFQGRYYIQEQDRSSGIGVLLNRTFAPGTLVDVTGTLTQVGGELLITSASDTSRAGDDVPVPLAMNNRIAESKLTEGLLVTVWGRVVATGIGGAFRIDDGARLLDSSSNVGLRVYHGGSVSGVTEGSYLALTGVRGMVEGVLGNLPALYLKDASDIVTHQ